MFGLHFHLHVHLYFEYVNSDGFGEIEYSMLLGNGMIYKTSCTGSYTCIFMAYHLNLLYVNDIFPCFTHRLASLKFPGVQ